MYTAKTCQTVHFGLAVHRFMARLAGVAAAVLLFAGVVVHDAQAQVEPLGDHYIFFVDGVNVTLPDVDGVVADDPKDASNKVMQFNNANYSFQAFRFDPAIDMMANRDAGNVMHFNILVDASNVENCEKDGENLAIMFEDHGDDASGDLPFRLRWTVPRSICNGEWHEVTTKLPPPTWQALEDGKSSGSISGMDAHWVYCGTWTSATQGVALDCMGPNSTENSQLWKEFEWNNVHAIGPFWDWGSAGSDGGKVYLDDVFIGPADLDLGDAAGQPAAMSGIEVMADGAVNVVSWTHNSAFGGYNVYASTEPITDVSASSVAFLGSVSFEADAFEMRHQVELPYSSSAGSTLYYAVTSLSLLGTENPDVSNSTKSIDNPDVAVSPAVMPLTEDQADALFDDVNAGRASNENFPSGAMPFVVDDMHSQLTEIALPTDNSDLSGSVWIAYSAASDGELYIYVEVTDDVLDFSPAADGPEGAWSYDSIEFGWGNYDVRDVGGSILGGSPHNEMMRGQYPDYQFRLSPHGGAADATAKTFVQNGADQPNVGTATYGTMTGGYKILAVFPVPDIKGAGDSDVPFPGEDEVRFFPLTISLNDRDTAGGRDHQITWSLNPTVNNNWWNTPSQWQTVAMVGPMAPTSSEGSELPEVYALAQNYPNPFNPATSIRFQLPQAEQVTLRVFDVLGREVTELLNNASLASGEHTVRFDASGLTSGVYLYRLEAGTSFVQTRRMMLVK